MNLLELVSAITGQGQSVTGTGTTIKHRQTILQISFFK